MLRACFRVLKPGGRLAFSAIHITAGLSGEDRDRAIDSGPDFVATDLAYEEMLRESGFEIEDHQDLAAEYRRIVRRWLHHVPLLEEDLRGALGDAWMDERLENRESALAALDAGLLSRSLFVAVRG